MKKTLFGLICLFFLTAGDVRAYAPPAGGAPSNGLHTKAIRAAAAQNYAEALTLAGRARDPKLIRLVEWMRLTDPKSEASFKELDSFLKKNKNWPRMYLVRRNAEKALLREGDKAALEKWFKVHPPVSPEAVLTYADILMARKEWEKAVPLLHSLWTKSDLTDEELAVVQEKLSVLLDERDYAARLEKLLWNRKIALAEEMLPHVDEDTRRLAEARIAFIANEKNARQKVKDLPVSLRSDSGLLYDEMRWFRRNKKFDDAAKILRHKAAGKTEKAKWWAERSLVVRQLLSDGKAAEAYRLAKDHRLSPGSDYADAEWLAGWIALRSLKNLEESVLHFSNMLKAVSSPVSVARGEYWLGRAYEELGKKEDAEIWYAKAAKKSTTIYGQLAGGKLSLLPELPQDAEPKREQIARIRENELFSIMQMLQAAEQYDLVSLFALRLYGTYTRSDEIPALAYVLTNDLSRPDLAVNLARRVRQNGIYIVSLGYPVLDIKPDTDAEQAVVLSIIRQESNFSSHVVSPAGARGLMQIMPSTAKQVARKRKKPFSPQMLSSNPHFNVEIGSAYFSEMVKRFNGSYILALAAYNAGPTNVRRWINAIGTPGEDNIDPIDWIEMIPFSETRNYVLRVLENLHIYRRHLNYPETAINMWTQN